MKEKAIELDISDLSAPLDPGITLIEASAGTGKTYTLASLFVRLILEKGLDISEILVTTFTIPATAELRDRIRRLLRTAHDAFAGGGDDGNSFVRALLERYGDEAEALRSRLEQALRAFDEAAIHTIHSFCQRMLQDRAFESGSAFDQEFLADEGQIIREVAEDFWRQRSYQCEVCLVAAAVARGIGPQTFVRLLRERLNHPMAEVIPAYSKPDVAEVQRRLPQVLIRLQNLWQTKGPEILRYFGEENAWALKDYKKDTIRPRLDDVAECMGDLANLPGFASLLFFSSTAIGEGTRAKTTPPKHEFFELCAELAELCDRYARALQLEFLDWGPRELEERKVRSNVLSYADLLIRLRRALHGDNGDALATSIRTRFKAALIDEFQDTDPLQDEIFERVFGDGQSYLFLIGDPKQAIYSFRSADVFTYLNAADRANRHFTLGTNFRSATALVSATNHLFQRPSPDRAFIIDRIVFHPVKSSGKNDEETFSGDGVEAPFRIWAFPTEEKEVRGASNEAILAAVATEVARLLRTESRLGAERVQPRDIAILTRTNGEALNVLAALQDLGIPGVVLSNSSVFRTSEAHDVLAMLAAVSHPRDEARIRAALFTDLFGYSAAELHALSENETAWETQLIRFAEWHDLWTSKGFVRMFRQLLLDLDVRSRVLAMMGGERRLTNLLHLSELLQRASMDGNLSPGALLKWMARQISDPNGAHADDSEMRLERDDDAVRIVTVHKSKGLEYNIVFCPFLWHRRSPDKHAGVRFHDPKRNWKLIYDLGTDESDEHEKLADEEDLAEQTRLLYVALTRARQRCDLFWGQFKGYHESAAAWILHAPPAPSGEVAAALTDHVKPLPKDQWRSDLDQLAAGSKGTIAIVEPPDAPAPVPSRDNEESPTPATPRTFSGTIESDWSVSSFSSLSEQYEAETPDRDAQPEALPELDEQTPVGIHAFPAGTRAGVCFHGILQDLDFTKPEGIDLLVEKKLQQYSFDPKQWQAPVADCLRRMLAVPLSPGFSLGEIPKAECLAELEFYVPARRLESAALRQLLSSEAEHLEFSPKRGWLKGFIDLVFRHKDRFYIADWKSNRLGTYAGAYHPAALASAMASHQYPLQYHLYTVALHRYLQQRLPGYSYEQHFGGVFYIFLRGVEPSRPELGIVHARPKEETIEGLSDWLK